MRYKIYKILIVLILAKLSVGCATIINGTSQDISVSTVPDNAEVWINGEKKGTTPISLTLKRDSEYDLKIIKAGFKDYNLKITQETSGWIAGNIIFGGLIGCIVDGASGGCYDLTPEVLEVNLSTLDQTGYNEITVPSGRFEKLKELRFYDENKNLELTVNLK